MICKTPTASRSPSVMIFFPAFTNSFHITAVSSPIFSSRFGKTHRFSLVRSASQLDSQEISKGFTRAHLSDELHINL